MAPKTATKRQRRPAPKPTRPSGGGGASRRRGKRRTAEPPAHIAERLQRVRAELRSRNLDALLVLSRMDQYWLTGFTGEDGQVLVTPRDVVLLTDGRFDETADLEAPWAKKVVRKKRGPETTAKELKKRRIARLGYNASQMSVALFTKLRELAPDTKLKTADDLISNMRIVKDHTEIEAIRKAIDVAERAFKRLLKWLKPGMKENAVAARLIYDLQRLGASGPSFPPIVASGAGASLPHYEPGDREVVGDKGLLIDWGARVDWYVSDLTRCIWPGSIPRRLGRVYEIVREAHDKAVAAVKPGVTAGAVDKVARDHITDAGFGDQFSHSLGHGIGLDVHEQPGLRRQSDTELKAGMVMTIEPGIYLPGKGGIRLESDVLVTADGAEMLSTLSM